MAIREAPGTDCPVLFGMPAGRVKPAQANLSPIAATQGVELAGIHLALGVDVAMALASVVLLWLRFRPRGEQRYQGLVSAPLQRRFSGSRQDLATRARGRSVRETVHGRVCGACRSGTQQLPVT